MSVRSFAGALTLLSLLALSAAAQTKLLRFPDIHGDKVVFTYGGDLWTAPAAGGTATRLTAHPGLELFAKFSPDGKWIAFTQQRSSGFDICVVPAGGGDALVLVAGEDPSWSPNSRTLVFTRRTAGHNYALSVLDVMTKQVKDIQRTAGNDSQPAWAR